MKRQGGGRIVSLSSVAGRAGAGTVATERWKALRGPEERQKMAERVPVRRVSEPEEIAEAVMLL